MTLSEGLGKLMAEGRKLARPALLVALYELVQDHLHEVKENAPEGRWRSIYDVLEATVSRKDLWSDPLPEAFWRQMDQLYRSQPPELVARAGLALVDATSVSQGTLRLEAHRVERSFFHSRSFWVLPRHPAGGQGSIWGEEMGPTSGLSPHRWLPSTRIVPVALPQAGVTLQIGSLDETLSQYLGGGTRLRRLRIGVSPIARNVESGCRSLGSTIDQGGKRFSLYRFTEQSDLERLGNLLRKKILPACEKQKVAVLVLPELTVSPELRELLSSILAERESKRTEKRRRTVPRPILVVAGSYHEKDKNGSIVNRSTVMDYQGRTVQLVGVSEESQIEWTHDKVARYLVETKTLGDQATREKWAKPMGLDKAGVQGGAEPEKLGGSFTVVGGPIGWICAVICIDYLTHSPSWWDLLQGAWFDWFIVPSATFKVEDFEMHARHLAINGAGTVIANACWLPEAFDGWGKRSRSEEREVHWWTGWAHFPGNRGRWILPGVVKERSVPSHLCGRGGCPEEPEGGCLFVLAVKLESPVPTQPSTPA